MIHATIDEILVQGMRGNVMFVGAPTTHAVLWGSSDLLRDVAVVRHAVGPATDLCPCGSCGW